MNIGVHSRRPLKEGLHPQQQEFCGERIRNQNTQWDKTWKEKFNLALCNIAEN